MLLMIQMLYRHGYQKALVYNSVVISIEFPNNGIVRKDRCTVNALGKMHKSITVMCILHDPILNCKST